MKLDSFPSIISPQNDLGKDEGKYGAVCNFNGKPYSNGLKLSIL